MAQLTNTILNGKLIVNGDIYGNLKGSATNAVTLGGKAESSLSVYSAGRLTTARTITLSGDVTGSVNFDGASNVTIDTTVANAGNAITVTTSAVNSTTTYNLVGVSSSSPSNVYKTGITVSGNTINATEYTLNVGTITGNFEISGAVEDATYAVAAGKLQAGKSATNGYSIGSSTLPIYFSNGIPVACSTSLGVSITGNAASASKLALSNYSQVKGYLLAASVSTSTGALVYTNTNIHYTAETKILSVPNIDVTNTVSATTFIGTFSGNATSATSATSAGYANKISTSATSSSYNYYIPFVTSSSSVTSTELYVGNSKAFTFNPSTGVVTAPTFSGTFSGNITSATSATSAGYASRIVTTTAFSNQSYYIPFVASSTADSDGIAVHVGGSTLAYNIQFNPYTGVVTAATFSGSLNGNATSATSATSADSADSAGYANNAGYATSAGYTAKVSAASATSKNYIIGAASTGSSQAIYANSNIYVTGGNTIVAPTFSGTFSGNATSATKATSLSTSTAGSASLPVYFSGGKPVACNTNAFVRASGNTAVQYIQVLTSTEYTALSSKNANVIYFITP